MGTQFGLTLRILFLIFIAFGYLLSGIMHHIHNFSCEDIIEQYSKYTGGKGFNRSQLVRLDEMFYQKEPCLTTFVRKFEIHHPAHRALNLKSAKREFFSQFGQDKFVDKLLESKRNGFFVECGAGDGEYLSNTLFLERRRGWSGLLIEADPVSFRKLRSKNRKSYLVNACLSTSDKAQRVQYQLAGLNGGIAQAFDPQFVDYLKGNGRWTDPLSLQCYPLHVLLQAVNQTHVDYFSLDIEGGEVDVLRSLRWDLITINVLTVEFRVLKAAASKATEVDNQATRNKFQQVQDVILSTGLYEVVGTLPTEDPASLALDIVFKRKSK